MGISLSFPAPASAFAVPLDELAVSDTSSSSSGWACSSRCRGTSSTAPQDRPASADASAPSSRVRNSRRCDASGAAWPCFM